MRQNSVPTSHFVPIIIVVTVLFVVASLPGSDLHEVQIGPENPLVRFLLSDPFMHFFTLAALTLLVGIGHYLSRSGKIPLGRVVLLPLGYGIIIEVYQWILPWRAFGMDDLLWNTVGILLALGLLWGLQRKPHGVGIKEPQTSGVQRRERRDSQLKSLGVLCALCG